jgi:hypothetical protein
MKLRGGRADRRPAPLALGGDRFSSTEAGSSFGSWGTS